MRLLSKNIALIICFTLLFPIVLYSQEYYRTEPKINQVHTLLVRNGIDWLLPPIIKLNKDEFIDISFDEFNLSYRNLYYEIIHCNADWTQSSISELDYLNGFNRNPVKEYATSFNTRMDYTHYSLILPNSDVSFKVSGNYAVIFYDEDTKEQLAVACFSVTEDNVSVGSNVIVDTDIAFKKEYQQLEISISYPQYTINNPQTELNVIVEQNRRTDNQVSNIKPTFIQNRQLRYEHNKDLIFEAGNEYRRFEIITTHYTGMGIERMTYRPPYYHVEIQQPVKDRLESGYLYEQDLNGRSFIRYDNATDNSNIEADYVIAHFYQSMDPIMDKGDMYVIGEFTCNKFNDFCKMSYDEEMHAYHAAIPIKLGAYDYQYVFVPEGATKATTTYTEGNYYETKNEYLIKVYHRPLGERYDKLVGYGVIESFK